MTHDETFTALLAEAETLDRHRDIDRLLAIYAEAAALVDREAKPKKWAGLRHLAGALAFTDPSRFDAALTAFRDAVPHWDPVADHGAWAEATSYIGWILFARTSRTTSDGEEAIACLETTLSDYPDDTPAMLAQLYGTRRVGDPLANWQKHVRYLEMTLGQVSAEADPVRWALMRNDLALATAQEPEGDFYAAMERRAVSHREARAALDAGKGVPGSAAQNAWIRITVDASEAVLYRTGAIGATGIIDGTAEALQLARDAAAVCGPATPPELRATATLALARVLTSDPAAATQEDATHVVTLCDEAAASIEAASQPGLVVTLLRYRANAALQLLRLGDDAQLEPLIEGVDTALELLDPAEQGDARRPLLLVAADALVESADWVRAADYLVMVEREGERSLAQATSHAGRLECIFNLHGSSARLGYCLLQSGRVAAAVEALDRGKGRLWSAGQRPAGFAEMRSVVPDSGALLFFVFGPKDGAVVVVADHGERTCALPGFGSERLHELLFGGLVDPDGSACWIARYLQRGEQPQRWADCIDGVGALLHEVVWQPVLQALHELGIGDDAELVCFAQGGLGALPLHAAWEDDGHGGRRWLVDRFAIRYAPSARCLLANTSRTGDADPTQTLIVCDPRSDLAALRYAGFEAFWLGETLAAASVVRLDGAEATLDAVATALPAATLAHFACHGQFDVGDPMRSNVVLAGGRRMSLADLLPIVAGSRLRTVVLSACETGVAQSWRRPDEMIGFPTAFLEQGVSTVLATLWPIDDFSSAALIGRYYRERHAPAPAPSPAQSLRAAQRWLRDATVAELRELMSGLESRGGDKLAAVAASVQQSLDVMDAGARPLAHPQFWAPCTVSGA